MSLGRPAAYAVAPTLAAIVACSLPACASLIGTDLEGLRPKDDVVANDAATPTPDASDAGTSDDATLPEPEPTGDADRRYAQWPAPPISPAPSAYTVTPETARDSVTDLVWQRNSARSLLSADEAATYCEDLSLGGREDWRLPTRIELLSIVDYGATIGRAMFAPGVFVGYTSSASEMTYWTSSVVRTKNETLRFAVDFESAQLVAKAPSASHPVRCVRGGKVGRAPRWARGADVAKDTFTGLEWMTKGLELRGEQRSIIGRFEEAVEGCARVTIAGGGFRLPTIKELHTLYDEQAPLFGSTTSWLDPNIDWTNYGPVLWSATPSPVPTKLYVVDFHEATTYANDRDYPCQVLCVR